MHHRPLCFSDLLNRTPMQRRDFLRAVGIPYGSLYAKARATSPHSRGESRIGPPDLEPRRHVSLLPQASTGPPIQAQAATDSQTLLLLQCVLQVLTPLMLMHSLLGSREPVDMLSQHLLTHCRIIFEDRVPLVVL